MARFFLWLRFFLFAVIPVFFSPAPLLFSFFSHFPVLRIPSGLFLVPSVVDASCYLVLCCSSLCVGFPWVSMAILCETSTSPSGIASSVLLYIHKFNMFRVQCRPFQCIKVDAYGTPVKLCKL